MKPDDAEIEAYLDGLVARLPRPMARFVSWLRKPEAGWIRRVVALLLIAAGPFGFLPVLGFWMLPLGILLIGEDIPALRRATIRLTMRAEAWMRHRPWR